MRHGNKQITWLEGRKNQEREKIRRKDPMTVIEGHFADGLLACTSELPVLSGDKSAARLM
jgi:hypothetical protein